MPIYRVMDEEGNIRPDATDPGPALGRDLCVKAYSAMVRVAVMDSILYESQRQGRISFYMTSWGEEATHIGTSLGISQEDEIFAQYREVGTLLWRGYPIQAICDQCFGNADDLGKGRQMPVHYGSAAHHFQTISSPLCTQLPQAVGSAYFNKLQGKGRAAIVFFGEGAASEGDFHAGMNMAATQSVPLIFFCRNNGYAISTPVTDQYRGDGIAARGVAYGMHTIRCDGNDIWAVYEATKKAREIATGQDGTGETKPVLIEAMTYREGHHSTSDDSTRYRKAEEIAEWRAKSNPIKRMKTYLENKGWWNAEAEASLVAEERRSVLAALAASEAKPRPAVSELFTDVYGDKELPPHLAEQAQQLDHHLKEYPDHYPSKAH
jgi:2-oxoisovalerate dehydrogenase E1 component alpha subunit